MAKSTQLKMSQVKKIAKQNNQQEEYTLHDDTTLKFYPIFPESKIITLLEDYQKLIIESSKKGIELTDKLYFSLIHFLCIKHFTHLSKDLSDSLEQNIEELNFLVDGGYYREIIEDVFLPAEINKVLDRISDVIGTSQAMTKMLEKAQQKAQELELKNRDVIEQLNTVGKQKQIPEV